MGRWKHKDPHKNHVQVVLNDAEKNAMIDLMNITGERSVSAFCRKAILNEIYCADERRRAMDALIAACDRLEKKSRA